MAKRPSTVSKADVAKAVAGVIAGGVASDRIAGVKVTPEGVFVLFGETRQLDVVKNEWDEVLPK